MKQLNRRQIVGWIAVAISTAEVDEDRAYIIVYDGKVWPRTKQLNQDYLGFRCVKQP